MSTQRSGTGGRPVWYQTAVVIATLTVRARAVPLRHRRRRPRDRGVGGDGGPGGQPRTLQPGPPVLAWEARRLGSKSAASRRRRVADRDWLAPSSARGEDGQRRIAAVGGDDGALRIPATDDPKQLARSAGQRFVSVATFGVVPG